MLEAESDVDSPTVGSSSASDYSSLTLSFGNGNGNRDSAMEAPLSVHGVPVLAGATVSQDIRNLVDAYGATLSQATKEIRALTKSKATLEKSYEQLLDTNETLVQDLMAEIRHRKYIEEERERVTRANEELFDEAQRLSDRESVWDEEKAALEADLANVTRELESLKSELCDVEAMEMEASERNAKMMESLKSSKAALDAQVAELEIENQRLIRELQMAEEERDAILSRKEMISGENMQLIVEAENNRVAKVELMNQLRSQQERCQELERENAFLRSAPPPPQNDVTNEKFASVVERNKLLSEWREQLIEKNQVLTDENKKLKAKCSGLEELLREEETDINDVLELIRNMQGATKNGPPPISPMSAVAAKLRRDFK